MPTPRHLYIGSMRPMGSTDSGIGTVCGDTPEYDSNQHSFVDTLYISRTTCIQCLLKIHTVVEELLVSLGYNELGEDIEMPEGETNANA